MRVDVDGSLAALELVLQGELAEGFQGVKDGRRLGRTALELVALACTFDQLLHRCELTKAFHKLAMMEAIVSAERERLIPLIRKQHRGGGQGDLFPGAA